MCNQILNGHAVPDAGNILQADATDFGVGWIDDVRWAAICPVSGVSGRSNLFTSNGSERWLQGNVTLRSRVMQ